MKLDLLGGTAEAKYKNLNSQRTINWYPVPGTQAEMNKNQKSLFPTPGLSLFATATGTRHRGAVVAQSIGLVDRCFFVIDTTLYELFQDSSIINRGSVIALGVSTHKVSFKINGNNEMFIGSTVGAYSYMLNTNVMTRIDSADIDYPGMDSCDYMDGYVLISRNGRVYFNNTPNVFTSWVGTDVFTPTFKADSNLAVGCLQGEVYCFGSATTEVYINDGVSPFIRRSGSSLLIGIAAVESLAISNDGFVFLGKNELGQFAVYTMQSNYTMTQISPFSINWALNNSTGVKDAYAFMQYTKDGHVWYHITIPSLRTTYVYDLMSKEWFERQSKQPFQDSDGADIYREFRCKYCVNFNGKNLLFDNFSGKIFEESYSTFTEDGMTIKRIRTSQIVSNDEAYSSASTLQIDCNVGEAATNTGQGVDPILMLEISRDGGRTFGNPRNIKLGKLGQFVSRAKINRLGIARNWVLRLTLTDPVDLMLQNAIVFGTASTNE